ncbi:Carbonic anhydrase [Mycena sanguinolenta]|uniref:Carbonic anhydrase n=1 Tax=Mycena sanguinolenta TaxID=230812 RepID=A0A8H6YUA3_9AGAR|nr:Carbonic anhydrase [Mycena sanguinolenta]
MNPDLLQANEKYAANFASLKPDMGRFRNMMIIACCDPRVDPYDLLGLKNGEALIIRNAGGSAVDAVRSIMVPQHSFGVTGEIAVIHHTDCGMTKVTTDQMRELVKKANPARDDVAATVDSMDFYHILNIEEAVKNDVKFLSENPLLLKGTKLSGWVHDLETGKISKVVESAVSA